MTDPTPPELDGGTFDVVRARLDEQGRTLAAAAQKLNARRLELFGGVTTALVATARVRTENNCVPRDVVNIGGRFLLGYQVFMGLKSSVQPADVFTELVDAPPGVVNLDPEHPPLLLDGEAFLKDFRELFQYYKDARLLHLRRTDRWLLAVFQTGQRLSDVRVLRWALTGHGAAEQIRYVDNRGDRDYTFPASHDFEWTRTTREQHVHGTHPHINIADEVFIECVGGDLTIKVEDNTETGAGVFSEPVDDPTQGLDDAEIHYAVLDSCILFKVRPYRENAWRHIVFNRRTREAVRIDALGQSCRQLPEGHGLVFPGGYWLSNGVHKVFPVDTASMEYKRTVRAPNGEDVAYVYYRREAGAYLLLTYNLITREVASPVACSSYCLLPDGRLVVLRAEPEPTRVHTLQVWQTAFVSDEHAAAHPVAADGMLARLGNRELVRAVSDLTHLARLVANQRPARATYEELLRTVGRVVDSYPWLGDGEAYGLRSHCDALRTTAERVIDEFEKVVVLTRQAAEKVHAQEQAVAELEKAIAYADPAQLDGFVRPLVRVTALRGQVETLRGVRHVDAAKLDALDARLAKDGERLAQGAIALLLKPEALNAYRSEIDAIESGAAALTSVNEAAPVTERIEAGAAGLDLLVGTVDGLGIADANQRTAILEGISEVYARLNRARAILANRRKELGSKEAAAAFAVQSRLLQQAVANAVALNDTPEKIDEAAGRLMTQVEELEGRFADHDAFTADLAAKRVEITEALQARRQALLDERQRKADGLARAADRVLISCAARARTFTTLDELNAWFAADPLVAKARELIATLRTLGDTVRADDAEGRLKSAREDGVRMVRDKGELFDGAQALKLGRHRFSVTTQPLELTMLPRPDAEGRPVMHFHLTGTDYWSAVADETFSATAPFWACEVESETPQVYRAEYLAWQILDEAERSGGIEALRLAVAENRLPAVVQEAMAARYAQGYERGVHDHDTTLILGALLDLHGGCGLLRFGTEARAVALIAWARCPDAKRREILHLQGLSLGELTRRFGHRPECDALATDCAALVREYAPAGTPGHLLAQAGRYLVAEMAEPGPFRLVKSGDASELETAFLERLRLHPAGDGFRQDLESLRSDATASLRLAGAWVGAFAERELPKLLHAVPEVVAGLLAADVSREDVRARTATVVEGLLGQHPRITDKRLPLRIDEFTQRLAGFTADHVPAWRAYAARKQELIARERGRLRLDELKPRVLTSFVRNRLINEVFLPAVGDNLAKQVGALGEGRRTDLQGLLLLISPPGYGKTTLMEYLCAVLGLAFVKVNGPALGNRVHSLDPAEAPNAGARGEVERCNLAFAMGNNVMLYVDDIQHCDPEFLQKFISLCDGQRKVEGVWNGQARTWDLRGKRLVVVMAGNPYTESGERFRIPDMLANRADTYNLGDVVGRHAEAFALSYLENALVVNPVLAALATRPQQDLYRLIRMSQGDDGARGELEHPYTGAELNEITAVLRHLTRVQQALLIVNQTYIASAASADAFRTEPPFKLQGSYRNMAKIAARIVPAMEAAEVDRAVLDHYRAEAQTLTTGAEANLLKLKALLGAQDATEAQRWADICRIHARRQEMAGADDPASKAVVQLALMGERIDALRQVLVQAAAGAPERDRARDTAALAQQTALVDGLANLARAVEAARPAPGKTEIINTLPRYYAQLYTHNIQVIEKSLVPVLDLLGKYVGSTQQARTHMETIAADLRAMLGKQNKGETIEMRDDGAK